MNKHTDRWIFLAFTPISPFTSVRQANTEKFLIRESLKVSQIIGKEENPKSVKEFILFAPIKTSCFICTPIEGAPFTPMI